MALTYTEDSMASSASKRAELYAALGAARAHTDALFTLLSPAALYTRAVAERHRFIFYVGHLEAFDWNLLGRRHLGLLAEQPALDHRFAFGIDPDPADEQQLPHDCAADWPAADTVLAYRRQTRQAIDRHLPALPAQLLHVATEHRLMHAETLCYLMHWLPAEQKTALAPPQPDERPAPAAARIDIPAGTATLGRHVGFGWDNEFQQHCVEVPAFAIARYKVTNGDYLRFVRDGGPLPYAWRLGADGRGFRLHCMFGEIPLPPSWPVYVTHEQASAYAAWAGLSLPTEAQFHRAAFGTPDGREREHAFSAAAAAGNCDFAGWDPLPVDGTPQADSAFGVAQLVGNGWEWTATPFSPFPGFAAFPFYPGYSADFFDGRHMVCKGASARTARCLLRRSFRNWYRPNYPYVYAGFRCVWS